MRSATPGRAAALVALLAVALLPGPAGAHAAFVSSQPAPGEELGSAPGVVVLRFTEPLIERLSGATVTDPNGQPFEGEISPEREIQVPIATNAPGVYEVEWKTVSPVDGHTLRGSFRFGVGVAPGEGAEGETASAPQSSDLLIGGLRWLEYAALLLAVGMLLLRRLAARPRRLPWARPRLGLALAAALVSGVGVVLGEATLAVGSLSPGAVGSYLTSGLQGAARLTRLAAEGAALATAGVRRGTGTALSLAVVALAGAGHAAAVPPRWWGVSVDAVHLLSAGLWAGSILALATVRAPGGWRGPEGRALLDRFSPVAVAAFLVTVGTGILRGTQELAGLGDLFGTSYGLVLTAKAAGVLAMVPLSVLAWRRLVRPGLEAALGVLVIGAAALLAAYPLPPARVGEAAAAVEPPGRSALPRPGELTFGGEAGEVLLGLTLRPGEPGRNEALLYLLPLEGEDAAAGIPARLSVAGRPVEMEECGPTCRKAVVELAGGERVEVEVGGMAGGQEAFQLPELPAPDGTRLSRRMEQRMSDLRSYRLEEDLSSGRAIVRATYAFRAPDRMRIELDTGFQTVFVGQTRYRRDDSGEPWEREERSIPTRVPFFIWGSELDVMPRVVGEERVERRPTTILSFFRTAGRTPIWFRLWVDREGLVRRAEMRAQGHFMDHRYFAFDAPITIEPPA